MLIIIKKDDATSIPREVADLAEARGLAAQGFEIFVPDENGTKVALADMHDDEPAEKVETVEPPPAEGGEEAEPQG